MGRQLLKGMLLAAFPLFVLLNFITAGAPKLGPLEQGLLFVFVLLLSAVIAVLGMIGYRKQLGALDEEEFIAQASARVQDQLDELNRIISGARARISACENAIHTELPNLSAGASVSLASARRILLAMQQRMDDVVALLVKKDGETLAKAEALSLSPLTFANSKLETLEGAEIPDLLREHWDTTMSTLLTRVELDVFDRKKVA